MNKATEKQRNRYYDNPFALPPECDTLCLVRSCFNKYENRGNYSQGRGYTSYYTDFRPVCGTRMCQGCPSWRNTDSDQLSVDRARELLTEKRVPRKIRDALTTLIARSET